MPLRQSSLFHKLNTKRSLWTVSLKLHRNDPTVSPTAGLKVEEEVSVESSNSTNNISNSGPNHPTSHMISLGGYRVNSFLSMRKKGYQKDTLQEVFSAFKDRSAIWKYAAFIQLDHGNPNFAESIYRTRSVVNSRKKIIWALCNIE